MGISPDDLPLASAVGEDIPDKPEYSNLPNRPTDAEARAALPPATVEQTGPRLLIRTAIEKLRDAPLASRHNSLAITKLEEALLWLDAENVL